MRLLIVCSQYPPRHSAESAHTLLLCEQLATRGIEIHLLTSELLLGYPAPRGFRLHPVMKSWGWGQLPTLLRTIRRLNPDAVLLIYIDWIYGCHPMITFAPAALRWLQPRAPFVTQFENVSGLTGMTPPYGKTHRLFTRLISQLVGRRGLHPTYGSLLRDSDHIITLSERHLEVLEQAHPGISAKSKVIPAPPSVRFAAGAKDGSARRRGRAMLGISEQEILLAYFGYVYWMKDMETLLTAFGHLPSNTRLVIIGASDENYLYKLHKISRDAGGADRVIWTGHCKPEEEIASLYLHAADICVLPFTDGVRLNNSSFAVAASHGVPIVTTRGETLESPFLDGENVKLCPARDPTALAAAITELISSQETRSRLAAGASNLATSYFSWERIIDSTLNVLQSAVAKR
jgi:polysaccharide biosynthesis protein PslF